MWKQDLATQNKVVNDLYIRDSALATYAGISEAEFKAGMKNPASFIADPVLFNTLNAEYQAGVGKVTGYSLAPDFETYKTEVLDGTDYANRAEYDVRLG